MSDDGVLDSTSVLVPVELADVSTGVFTLVYSLELSDTPLPASILGGDGGADAGHPPCGRGEGRGS